MPYDFTAEGLARQEDVRTFMDDFIFPNETEYYRQYHAGPEHGYPPILDDLKAEAKNRGLWNLFLPHLREGDPGTKLSNLDYAPISEAPRAPDASRHRSSDRSPRAQSGSARIATAHRLTLRIAAPGNASMPARAR